MVRKQIIPKHTLNLIWILLSSLHFFCNLLQYLTVVSFVYIFVLILAKIQFEFARNFSYIIVDDVLSKYFFRRDNTWCDFHSINIDVLSMKLSKERSEKCERNKSLLLTLNTIQIDFGLCLAIGWSQYVMWNVCCALQEDNRVRLSVHVN